MNKQTIITILLAFVTMAGQAQTKTATITGYSPALVVIVTMAGASSMSMPTCSRSVIFPVSFVGTGFYFGDRLHFISHFLPLAITTPLLPAVLLILVLYISP